MNVDLGIWDKLARVAMFLLFIAGLLLVAIWYYPLIKQNEKFRAEMFRLDLKIQKEEERSRQLKNSLDALRNDPKTVERLAREQLKYARPGETVIQFEAPATNISLR